MPSTTNIGRSFHARGSILTADLNAGIVIIPARSGETLIVGDFWVRAIGGAANCTAITLSDGTVTVASVAAAAATQNTVVRPETSSVTATNLNQSIGATYCVGEGKGLKIICTGTESSLTSLDYFIDFIRVAA